MPHWMLRRGKLSRRAKLSLLAFCAAAGLVALVYAALGWWPFGDGSILTGDLNGLYVNYIADLWRRVRQGGFFYSFGKLCGGSTLGLFAYYMNSPFNLLYALFPIRAIPAVAGAIFLLRTGLTAGCFCWYLCRHFGAARALYAPLSLGYALCAYCVAYNQNIIWMDVVWMLPLVLAALDALTERGCHWPFTLALLLCILFNFYVAWPVCLFCLLYYFTLARRVWGSPARRFARFAASGVLAAGLALFYLVPVLSEVQQSKGALFDFAFSLTPQFPLWELPYRLFFGNFFWADVTNGLPNLYCGSFAVALGLLYFFGRAPRREKLAAGALLGALTLSFWIKGLDLIWHGFKEPVWFPYRYSFLFSAVLLLLAARALGTGVSRRGFWGAAALAAVWLAGYPAAAGQNWSAFKLCAGAGVLLVSFGAAWVLLVERGQKPALPLRRLAAGALCLAVLADLGANSALTLRKFESYTVSGFTDFTDNATAALNAIRAQDTGLYRVEKNFFRTLNDPFLIGYWGISHYSSTKASTAKELLEQLGYVNYSTYGWGSTAVADSLLGIKYLYSDGSRPLPGQYRAAAFSAGSGSAYTIWQNPTALPLAYLGSSAALAVDPAAYDNTFALQNEMLTALAPGAAQPLQSPALSFSTTEKGTLQVEFTAATDGPCYLAIPGTDLMQPADVVVNGKLYAQYFEGDSLGGVLPLGSFAKGEQVTLVLGFLDAPQYRAAVQIACLDTAALQAATDRLCAAAPTGLTMKEGGTIRAECTAAADTDLLVIPVAYDTAWRATVNGKAADVKAVFGGFLAVELPQGQASVELHYTHPGTAAGAGLSLGFAALALLWALRERKKARGQKT